MYFQKDVWSFRMFLELIIEKENNLTGTQNSCDSVENKTNDKKKRNNAKY